MCSAGRRGVGQFAVGYVDLHKGMEGNRVVGDAGGVRSF